MRNLPKFLMIIPYLAASFAGALLFVGVCYSRETMPDFAAIKEVGARKQAFIHYLKPMIDKVNRERASEREELKSIIKNLQKGNTPGVLETYKLKEWAQRYDLDYQQDNSLTTAKVLLMHLDQLPVSMVLAQAAMESAWGRSRFAIEGNNFFGQWCFEKGCGIVPSRRNKGAKHEVRVFDSTEDSIVSYFRNINRHPSYRKLRKIRSDLRSEGRPLSGYVLVAGLERYSQRRKAYVDELRIIIRYNKLEKLNQNQ